MAGGGHPLHPRAGAVPGRHGVEVRADFPDGEVAEHLGRDVAELLVPVAGNPGEDAHGFLLGAAVLGHHDAAGQIDRGAVFHGGLEVLGAGLRGADPDGQAQGTACEVGKAGSVGNDVLGEQPGVGAEEVQGGDGVLADFQRHAEGAADAMRGELHLVVRPARIGIDVGEQDDGPCPQGFDARAVAEALLDAVQDDGPGAAPRHGHGLFPALQRHAAFDLGAGGVAECGRGELGELAEEVLDVLRSHQEVLQLQGGFVPGVVGHP